MHSHHYTQGLAERIAPNNQWNQDAEDFFLQNAPHFGKNLTTALVSLLQIWYNGKKNIGGIYEKNS